MDWLTLNSDSEQVVFGIFFLVLSGLLFPLFAVVITVLHSKTYHSPNLTYTLMSMILITELIQVICHFVTSPIFIFPGLQESLACVISILGNILNSAWIFEFPATTILAVCRVLIFTDIMTSQKMHVVLKILILLITIVLLFIAVISYQFKIFISCPPGWKYDQSAPYTLSFQFLEFSIVIPCLVINYVSYLAIAFLIYQKKRGSTVHSRRNELEILIQYTLLTIYTTISIVAWHKGVLWFDKEDVKVQAFINAMWIVECAFNPMLTLVLSRSIREECLRAIRKMSSSEDDHHIFAFAIYHH